MNITDTKKILPFLKKAGLVANLIGFHGLGKSSIVENYCQENNLNFYPVFLGQCSDAGDILGLPEFNRNDYGKSTSVSFIHPKLLPKEPNSVLFLDELSHAPKEIRGLLFQLILTGEMADYKLPANSQIIVAMNPDTEDYPATLDFSNKAFGDRFVHIKFDPTVEEFYQYMGNKHGSDSITLAFLREQPKLVEESGLASFNLDFVKPSRRSWDRLEKLKNLENFPTDLLMETAMGIVGTEASIAYTSFLSSQVKSLTGKDILNSFSNNEKTLRSYFEGEIVRSDILSKVASEIIQELEDVYTNTKDIPDSYIENSISFYSVVPKEVMWASLKETQHKTKLLLSDKFRNSFLQDKRIEKMVKEVRTYIKESKDKLEEKKDQK